MDINLLIKNACEARENSYSPYSGFAVGAALLTKSGKIYTGCNIENAAFSPTNCAERTAFFKAVSEGEREFEAVAVCGGFTDGRVYDEYCVPCGVCRQVMAEFCGSDFKIIAVINSDEFKIYTLGELLPSSFGLKEL